MKGIPPMPYAIGYYFKAYHYKAKQNRTIGKNGLYAIAYSYKMAENIVRHNVAYYGVAWLCVWCEVCAYSVAQYTPPPSIIAFQSRT